MQDGISKNTGNSRYLKSVANFLSLYPTYEDMAAALIAGELPIDLNGINPDGWLQIGTALNKANLLSDGTASILNLPEDATPNDALEELGTNRARIYYTSYVGTGTYGSADRTSVTFPFEPKFVIVLRNNNSLFYQNRSSSSTKIYLDDCFIWVRGLSRLNTVYTEASSGDGYLSDYLYLTLSGTTLKWYSAKSAWGQINASGGTYLVVGIG